MIVLSSLLISGSSGNHPRKYETLNNFQTIISFTKIGSGPSLPPLNLPLPMIYQDQIGMTRQIGVMVNGFKMLKIRFKCSNDVAGKQ